ncbi:unnamed protein product [Dovyalis caffra]|uniref:Uncharacterized protein n=1 Tax=Dovyalis caffra TaxID=77055 RepID=A0AAV1SAY8_9ROSI|nr:unnamed protein product [Dovyalis caffra]
MNQMKILSKVFCRYEVLNASVVATNRLKLVLFYEGVWTDGLWVFSIGLDRRIGCRLLRDDCKLTEQDHPIINVPNPNHYEIVVAGRGMQMVEFSRILGHGWERYE